MDRDISLPAFSVTREVGEFLPLKDALGPGPNLAPDDTLTLRAGELRLLEGRRAPVIHSAESHFPAGQAASRITIEAVTPCVDGGLLRSSALSATRFMLNATRTQKGTIQSLSQSCGGRQTRPFGVRSG